MPGEACAEMGNVPVPMGNSVRAFVSATDAVDGKTVAVAQSVNQNQEIVYASRMEQFGGLEADDVQRVRDLAREELTAMRVMENVDPALLIADRAHPVKQGTTDGSYAPHVTT